MRRIQTLILVGLTIPWGACGGRTVGVTYDGGPPPDARWAPDGATPPDAGPSGCRVSADPVVVHAPGEPAFVMSLDRMQDRWYVLGGATGWGDLQAQLWVLDGETLEPWIVLLLNAEMVWARYDPDADRVVAVTEDDGRVELQHFDIGEDGSLSLREAVFVCDACVASWQRPVVDQGRAAVAVRRWVDDEIEVFKQGSPAAAVVSLAPTPGSTPFLVERGSGPFLLHARDGSLYGLPMSWSGSRLAEPFPIMSAALLGVLTAEGDSGSASWGAVLVETSTDPAVWLLREGADGTPEILAELPGLVDYALPSSLSDSRGTVAIAWGETFGAGRVGPHVAVVDAQTGVLEYGPALIDEPSPHASASHSVWAAAAPHPDGHAVAWGGWRQETLNGIYAKLVICE